MLSSSVMSDSRDPMDCSPPGSSVYEIIPSKNTGVSCPWHYSASKNKDILPYMTTWMNLEEVILNLVSQSQRTNTAWFHLYEACKIVKLIETEYRMGGCQELGEKERGKYWSKSRKFQFCKMNKCKRSSVPHGARS